MRLCLLRATCIIGRYHYGVSITSTAYVHLYGRSIYQLKSKTSRLYPDALMSKGTLESSMMLNALIDSFQSIFQRVETDIYKPEALEIYSEENISSMKSFIHLIYHPSTLKKASHEN